MGEKKKEKKKESAPVVLGSIERLEIGEVFVRKTNKGMEIIKFERKEVDEAKRLANDAEILGKQVEVGVGMIPDALYKLLTK